MGTFSGVASLNTGSYYGSGSSSSSSTRTASSSNVRTFAKNVQAGYSSQIEAIENYLENGKIDKAMSVYENVLKDLADDAEYYSYNMNERQLESALSTAYKNTTGYSFSDAIEENTSSSFMTGLKTGIPLLGLLANGTSKDEAQATLNGEDKDAKDTFKEGLGAATSGAASGAVVGAGLGSIIPFGGTAAGAVVGAGLGAVLGVMQNLINN